jgi:hypothetical protein
LPKFNSEKSENLKKNFSKTLAASLAILNLFASNLNLVKATENYTSRKTLHSDEPENRSKDNIVKRVKSPIGEIKNIIKCAGCGTVALLVIYPVIKKLNIKNPEFIVLEELPESEENLLKKFQQWFEDAKKMFEKKEFKDFSPEEFRDFARLCLISTYLAEEFLKTLLKGLDFGENKGLNFLKYSEFEVKIINTNSTLVLDSIEDPFKKCDENHKTMAKVLGNLAPFFSCFSMILRLYLDIFRIKYSNLKKIYPMIKNLKINLLKFENGNFRDCFGNAFDPDVNDACNFKNVLIYIKNEKVTSEFLNELDKEIPNAIKNPHTNFTNLFDVSKN